MTVPLIPDLPVPATHWPFRPGHAVWYEPSGHSMTKPYLSELIQATIIDSELDIAHARTRIQRIDKPRATRVASAGLMFRGFCANCQVPAMAGQGGRLECPNCDAPPPPPDVLIVQWFPLDNWRVPMAIRRAAEHPDWSYWATRHDADNLIQTAYKGMLEQLKLPQLPSVSTSDIERWMHSARAIERLKFYAMLGHTDGFHAAYQELRSYQQGSSAAEICSLIDEITRDKLPKARPVFLPINIQRCKDDSEPDGPDDLTRWLEQQFRRAA
jgi:hypothetical protein